MANRKRRIIGLLVLLAVVVSGGIVLGVFLSGAGTRPTAISPTTIRAESIRIPSVGESATYLETVSDLTNSVLVRTETRHTLVVTAADDVSYTVSHTAQRILPSGTASPPPLVVEHIVDSTQHVVTNPAAGVGYPASLAFGSEPVWDSDLTITPGTSWQGKAATYAAAEGLHDGTAIVEVIGDGGATKASYTIRADKWPPVVEREVVLVEEVDLTGLEIPITYYPEKPSDIELPPRLPINVTGASTFRMTDIRLVTDP